VSALAGGRELVRLALRRDRLIAAAWIAAIGGLVAGTAAAFLRLLPTAASRLPFAQGIRSNPALRALIGVPFDLDTIGGLTAWRAGALAPVLAALMSLFAVVRHTRAEEESGRLELVCAGAVGRHAPLAAALIVAFALDLVAGLVVAAALAALRLPAAGALALGASVAGAGWLFAAFAAVAAQLTRSARAARGLAAGALAAAYLVRAAGDAADSWLAWLSPIGWCERIRPFAGERWGLAALIAAAAAAAAAAALVLQARRDLGAGAVAERSGPGAGGPGGVLALAWRLQRGPLLAWLAGFAVAGAIFGGVADSVVDLLRGNPRLLAIVSAAGGAHRLVDSFFAAAFGFGGVVAAACAVQAALRLRAEETALRLEPILATPVGRLRWALGHVAHAAAAPALCLAAMGLAAGLAHGGDVLGLAAAALAHAPAAWVVGAIAVALFGLAPRAAPAAWAALVLFFLLGVLGPLLSLPGWVMGLLPFGQGSPAGLAAAAAAVAAAGLLGFRRRDIG
jgi:polyether ionophore transport system permease protein